MSGRWWPRIGREILDAGNERVCADRLRRLGFWEAAALLEDEGLLAEAGALVEDRGRFGWRPLFAPGPPSLRLASQLGSRCPPMFWLYGGPEGLARPSISVVGSRCLTPEEAEFADGVGRLAARLGYSVVSGGAAGADSFAAAAATLAGGRSFDFLPGGSVSPERPSISRDPDSPAFSRVEALQRNRWIYASSEVTVVVASRHGVGGSWYGAIAARREKLSRAVVFLGRAASAGNEALAGMGFDAVGSLTELEALIAGHRRASRLAV
jgi:hypothetical protein